MSTYQNGGWRGQLPSIRGVACIVPEAKRCRDRPDAGCLTLRLAPKDRAVKVKRKLQVREFHGDSPSERWPRTKR